MNRPKVVYWTNMPTPYSVGRLNAVVDSGALDVQVWFDEMRQPDRSWDVDPSDWKFPFAWVPEQKVLGHSFRIPGQLLRRERPDLIVQLFDRPSTAVGALVSRAYARRLTYRVLPAFASWGRDSLATRAAKRFLFHIADGAKVPGPAGRALAQRWGLPADRCVDVVQTIDVRHYSAAHVNEAEVLAVRDRWHLRTTTFVYVGRLWSGKGLDHLIKAFDKLRRDREDVSLVIVGDGVDEGQYREMAAQVPDVHFVGFVQPAQLPLYYAASDVLVFPTLGDPHGLVVEEAMAAGLAVISSDAAGDILARVQGRAAGAVVSVGDSAALYLAMADFAGDRDRIRTLAENGRASVQCLTHEAYARAFEEFVSHVLARRPRRNVATLVARGLGRLVVMSASLRRSDGTQASRLSRGV